MCVGLLRHVLAPLRQPASQVSRPTASRISQCCVLSGGASPGSSRDTGAPVYYVMFRLARAPDPFKVCSFPNVMSVRFRAPCLCNPHKYAHMEAERPLKLHHKRLSSAPKHRQTLIAMLTSCIGSMLTLQIRSAVRKFQPRGTWI